MALSRLDLNLLLMLDVVLREGSVAKAADRLHVTPSAISNALARLRAALGDRLVTKKGRGIVPTPRALELAPLLAKTLRELQDAVRTTGFDARTTTRRFTIALSDVAQVVLLPPLIALMQKAMPQASLRAVGIDSLLALGGLNGAEVDVVIGPNAAHGEVHAEHLFDQPLVLICREGHPALGKKLGVKALGALRHVAVDLAPGQRMRNLAAEIYADAGVERHIAMTVPTFISACAVVAGSDLVATVPATLYRSVGASLRLRTLPCRMPAFSVATNLCWHARTNDDAAAKAFREIVRRAARQPSSRARNGSVGRRTAR